VNLASLVLIGTVSATLLDYLFKSGAAAPTVAVRS
jgi:hypothetical protein